MMIQQLLLAFHTKKLIMVFLLKKGPVMVQYDLMVKEKCSIAWIMLNPRNFRIPISQHALKDYFAIEANQSTFSDSTKSEQSR